MYRSGVRSSSAPLHKALRDNELRKALLLKVGYDLNLSPHRLRIVPFGNRSRSQNRSTTTPAAYPFWLCCCSSCRSPSPTEFSRGPTGFTPGLARPACLFHSRPTSQVRPRPVMAVRLDPGHELAYPSASQYPTHDGWQPNRLNRSRKSACPISPLGYMLSGSSFYAVHGQ